MNKLLVLATFALACSPALANTLVVDAAGGPGSQFNDIATAIAASSSGDVILVRAGAYSPFTVDRGIVIVGSTGVLVTGGVSVTGIVAAERAATVDVDVGALTVTHCRGPVILQNIVASAGIRCDDDDDVRMRNVTAAPVTGSACPGLQVTSTRLELVDGNVFGAPNVPYAPGAPDGWSGMNVDGGSSVHVLASHVSASAGSAIQIAFQTGPLGGSGITIDTSTLRIVGSRTDGAPGGVNWFYPTCDYDGRPGYAVASIGSTVFASSCVWYTPPTPGPGFHCYIPFGPYYFFGSDPVPMTPNDPMLRIVGTPTAGQVVTFEAYAPTGSTVDLVLGRSCVVNGSASSDVEELTSHDRVFSLGTVGASGKINRTFTIPSYLPRGFVFAAQTEVHLSGGQLRRANSVPIVVR